MRTLVVAVLFGAVAFAQPPVNFSGKWTIQTPAGRGGGRGGSQVLTLNQVGTEVSGELSGGGGGGGTTAPINNELWDGKVAGQTISFYVWRGNDKPVKTFYRGQLSADGDEIAFTVTGGPQGRGGADGRGGQAAGGSQPAPVIAKRSR